MIQLHSRNSNIYIVYVMNVPRFLKPKDTSIYLLAVAIFVTLALVGLAVYGSKRIKKIEGSPTRVRQAFKNAVNLKNLSPSFPNQYKISSSCPVESPLPLRHRPVARRLSFSEVNSPSSNESLNATIY